MAKYTPEELNNFSKEQLISLYENLQDQMEKLNLNMEAVLEQIRLAKCAWRRTFLTGVSPEFTR